MIMAWLSPNDEMIKPLIGDAIFVTEAKES